MKRAFSLIGVLLLVAITCSDVLAARPPDGGTTDPAPVTVTNTTANPVPITGDVGLAGTPTVIIGNSAGQPIPVGLPGGKTTSIYSTTGFYIESHIEADLVSGIDVSSCEEVRLSFRQIEASSTSYKVFCSVIDDFTGAYLVGGNATDTNRAASFLVQTPSFDTVRIRCGNPDTLPHNIILALSCR